MNIFDAVMATNDGNGVFDEKKISGRANVITRDTDTIIDFPKNIVMVMNQIKEMMELKFHFISR